MDEGGRALCAHYQVYVLKGSGASLDFRDAGVLELNDWEARRRTAIGYARGEPEIVIDGQARALEEGKSYAFKQIRIRAPNLTLECSQEGTALRSGARLRLDVQ